MVMACPHISLEAFEALILMETDNKDFCIAYGETLEHDFVALCKANPQWGMDVTINAYKAKNKKAPDLTLCGELAELKGRKTPFFTAGLTYGLDPRFAVTLNVKDVIYYALYYRSVKIVFWCDWAATEMQLGSNVMAVEPLFGVYVWTLGEVGKMTRKAAIHTYQRRINDTVNAKYSFVFDVRTFGKTVYQSRKPPQVLGYGGR